MTPKPIRETVIRAAAERAGVGIMKAALAISTQMGNAISSNDIISELYAGTITNSAPTTATVAGIDKSVATNDLASTVLGPQQFNPGCDKACHEITGQ